MAKKKPSQPEALVTYTARAKDLKILGRVEAANDKEALQKARKQYGAATVERRESATNDALAAPEAAAAEAGDAKATTRKKGKPGHATTPPATPATTATPAEANGTPSATPRRRAGPSGAKSQKLSALDAASQVLQEAGTPLSCQEMITAMAEKGYWSSPTGRTPSATLYSAILRELKTKGAAARFRKTDRGRFAHAPSA
jgi:HB1/ASXL restriction endonuclease-like protein with HTH domain